MNRTNKKLLLFISFLVITFTVCAQPSIEEIEAYIEQARIDWNVPGMSVAIVKDGKVFSSKGYGILKAGESNKVDKNSLFAIASNTKAFVSFRLATEHSNCIVVLLVILSSAFITI